MKHPPDPDLSPRWSRVTPEPSASSPAGWLGVTVERPAGVAVMEERVTQANYALRLQASIKAEAERLAKAKGATLNQFINVAVAEKLAALRTADFFRERARRANVPGALALLGRLRPRRAEPPRSGDELE
jgi:hypothetical protein